MTQQDFPRAHEVVAGDSARATTVEAEKGMSSATLTNDEYFKQEIAKILIDFEGTVTDDFTADSRMNIPPMDIELIEGARPRKCRTVKQIPINLQKEAGELKDRLVRTGVLRGPHNENRPWISPSKYVEKPSGGLHFIVDMTALNRNIKRSPHPFLSATDMKRSVRSSSKYFAKIDLVQGYHQIPLSEEASNLCSVMLQDGVYDMLCCTMGLVNSGDYFNFHTDDALSGLLGHDKIALKEVDDCLSQSESWEGIIENLRTLLTRCKELTSPSQGAN